MSLRAVAETLRARPRRVVGASLGGTGGYRAGRLYRERPDLHNQRLGRSFLRYFFRIHEARPLQRHSVWKRTSPWSGSGTAGAPSNTDGPCRAIEIVV